MGLGSFALGDDDKVDLWRKSRFSFAIDDNDLDDLSLQLVSWRRHCHEMGTAPNSWRRRHTVILSSMSSVNGPIGYHAT